MFWMGKLACHARQATALTLRGLVTPPPRRRIHDTQELFPAGHSTSTIILFTTPIRHSVELRLATAQLFDPRGDAPAGARARACLRRARLGGARSEADTPRCLARTHESRTYLSREPTTLRTIASTLDIKSRRPSRAQWSRPTAARPRAARANPRCTSHGGHGPAPRLGRPRWCDLV